MPEYKYPNIIQAVCSVTWAILPEKMNEILAFLEARINSEVNGVVWDGKAVTSAKNVKGNIVLLPLVGTISQRIGSLDCSGGTSADEFGMWFDAAIADPSIGAVVIDTNSPGGNVYGISELSEKIFNARGSKPIIAVVNSMMASAAYWIASAADEIVVTPGGEIGSVGVIAVHQEQSSAEEKAGFKTTVMTAGKFKGEANPFEPLGDDAKSAIEGRLNEYYDMFTSDLARNRDTKKASIMNGFGQGRMVGATAAVEEGMADRVGTLEQVIGRLLGDDAKKAKAMDRNRRAKLELLQKS